MDTTLCPGDSLVLQASFPGATNFWWPSMTTGPSIAVTQQGTYWGVIQAMCDTVVDQIIVNYSNPIAQLGQDTSFCINDSVALTPGNFAAYNWSNGDTTATINVGLPGTFSVMVADTAGCMDSDTILVSQAIPIIAGTVSQGSNGNPFQNTKVYLIQFNPLDTSLAAIDSTNTDSFGYYEFLNADSAIYVKVAPDSTLYPNEIPTYYDSVLLFGNSPPVLHPFCDTVTADFSSVPGMNPGGPGFIGGLISQGANKMAGPGDPVSGLRVMLLNSSNQPVGYATTNAEGYFRINGLSYDLYSVYVDDPRIDNSVAPVVSINQRELRRDDLWFFLYTDHLEWGNQATGTAESGLAKDILTVYPNPAAETVNVRFQSEQAEKATHIYLMNLLGERLIRSSMTLVNGQYQQQLQVGDLAKGVYFLTVETESGNRLTQKIVLQ